MKKFTVIALIALFALTIVAGCKQTENSVASVFDPIIGTWTTEGLISTTLVFNADKTCTDTSTILNIGTTTNGTWVKTDDVLTRTWDDNSVSVKIYTFNANATELTLSTPPDGLAVVYQKQ